MDALSDELIPVVRRAFGTTGLQTIPPDVLQRYPIVPADREFLLTVGVPTAQMFELSFNLADRLPLLNDLALERQITTPAELDQFVCLDEHCDLVVGIDFLQNGYVIFLDLTGQSPTRFVNSNVRLFIGFLAHTFLEVDSTNKASLVRVKSWMKRLDPDALSKETWWSIIFEQFEYQLL